MRVNGCWLYAISRYGYPPTIAQTAKALRELKAYGFTAVELEGVRDANLAEVWDARFDLKALAHDLGLEIMNFCPVLPDLVSLDAGRRRRARDRFATGVELARFFGSAFVQIDSFAPPLVFRGSRPYAVSVTFGEKYSVRIPKGFTWERQWDAIVESASHCRRAAKAAGLTLLLEPRVGEMVSNTEAMLRLLDAAGRDHFGVVLDTGHQHAQKELLPLSVMKLGKAIRYVHASDNDGTTNAHRAIGSGTIDWDGLFLALRRVGFAGWVGVDVGGVPNLGQAYRDSRRKLESLIRRHGG